MHFLILNSPVTLRIAEPYSNETTTQKCLDLRYFSGRLHEPNLQEIWQENRLAAATESTLFALPSFYAA
jgi:hypothetical protein